MSAQTPRNRTRRVQAGPVAIGGGAPISVQSMCATRTQDVAATVAQAEALAAAGAGLVRVAVDSKADAEALAEIHARTPVPLVVDLQESYRLASAVAKHIAKLRYNPGHLHHHERGRSTRDKVAWLADVAGGAGCALRVGVNCGSVAPEYDERFPGDSIGAMVACAVDHCALLDGFGFTNFVVSLKDSDPAKVVEANERFSRERPDVPLHLGVTEAGLLPMGEIKTRIAFEKLLARGIGDTLRVSLTLPNDRKHEEVLVALRILADVEAGRFRSVPELSGLNIISCPSCSRVENEAFVELAEKVRELTRYAADQDVTIAVMGCRVNGPGETDDADLGLWCGPRAVNLKRGGERLGAFGYDEVLVRLKVELDRIVASRASRTGAGR
ncbi:MAG: (E)-4-hydroxy-3-methylbut-2-enyl-diphosphate synthase [Deltaproteobacteria bacterium]|nr:(E)-4-hydroxy-3-methylbut-2-enyl-diphosphate synthase [Deltaproteobacteria bacterium]